MLNHKLFLTNYHLWKQKNYVPEVHLWHCLLHFNENSYRCSGLVLHLVNTLIHKIGQASSRADTIRDFVSCEIIFIRTAIRLQDRML